MGWSGVGGGCVCVDANMIFKISADSRDGITEGSRWLGAELDRRRNSCTQLSHVIDKSPYLRNKKCKMPDCAKPFQTNYGPEVGKVKNLSFKTRKGRSSLQGLCLFLSLSLPACLQRRPDVPFIAVACPRSAEKLFHSGQIWLWHFFFLPGQKPAHSYSGRFPDLDAQLTHMSRWYSPSSV